MNNKDKDKLIDALGMIDDDYIEEAHAKKKKGFNWNLFTKIAVGVACCVIAVVLVVNNMPMVSKDSAVSEDYYEYEMATGSTANYDYEDAVSNAEKSIDSVSNLVNDNTKLIITGSMYVETLDIDTLSDKLVELVNKYGGYYQSTNIDNSSNYRSLFATIRIPADNYTSFIAEVKELGNVTSYSEDTQDITTEYNDLQARINSLKAEEEQVLSFYEKAQTTEELITIEERLTEIRYEIDYLETQLKNYDLLTSYSTLNIHISETKEYTEINQNFFQRLGTSFVNGFKNFINGVGDFFVSLSYNIWTILLIAGIIFGLYKLVMFIIKKIKNKNNK